MRIVEMITFKEAEMCKILKYYLINKIGKKENEFEVLCLEVFEDRTSPNEYRVSLSIKVKQEQEQEEEKE